TPLLRVQIGNGLEGSNPFLSAIFRKHLFSQHFFSINAPVVHQKVHRKNAPSLPSQKERRLAGSDSSARHPRSVLASFTDPPDHTRNASDRGKAESRFRRLGRADRICRGRTFERA